MIRARLPLLRLLPLIPLLQGCEPADDPRAVAARFWDAARQGRVERAAELVSATNVAAVSDPGTDGSGIAEVTAGAVEVAGDVARVETRVVNDWAGTTRTIGFATWLVRELGDWRIDLDRTAGEIVWSMTPPKWLRPPRMAVPMPPGDTVMARDTAGMR